MVTGHRDPRFGARIALGGLFTLLGCLKLLSGPARWLKLGGAMAYLGIDAFPVAWGFAAALAELVCGLMLVSGRAFRPACAVLAWVMFVAANMHIQKGSPIPLRVLPIAVGLALLAVALAGPGTRTVTLADLAPLLKRRITLAVLAAALGIIAVSLTVAGSGSWNATPHRVGDSLLFEEHHTVAPNSLYTDAENAQMAELIDEKRFVTEAIKREEIWSIFQHPKRVGVGDAAPDFELRTVNGATMRLSDLRGRNVVFMFAAMTCPPARTQVPRLEELAARHPDTAFFLVYSRERHPGETGFPDFKYAKSDSEKGAYAQMLAALTTLPIAVDGIDEEVLSLYGNVPNATYVIDRHGIIAFRSTWTDSRKIERVLETLRSENKT